MSGCATSQRRNVLGSLKRRPINYCYSYFESYYRYRRLPTDAETFVHLSSFLASPDPRTMHFPAHRWTWDDRSAVSRLTSSFSEEDSTAPAPIASDTALSFLLDIKIRSLVGS
jgi:hypothetical protein